ncbi:MAG: rhodanese-like domain-containing protein [Epsilonproteobacteria bacterium]|uniref:rhodanese-like domain-containing protein n=1 Tax=Sulfurospirillum cavolei TaxID=366522 RepID=UPI0005AAE63B|nr:rhodanese-like domain-containing protein [Sulfurospirillum cavolei]NCB54723.1 rhodanese-like domain-containing protein [Campylobacterota bacterium]
MRKIGIFLIFLSSFLFADLRNVEVDEAVVKSGITVVDIRTKPEWADTGVVKGAVLLTFFDEQGRYDVDAFLKELDKHVSKDKEFALICRTGSRTSAVSDLLSKQGYKVVNLRGGMKLLLQKGYTPTPYNP